MYKVSFDINLETLNRIFRLFFEYFALCNASKFLGSVLSLLNLDIKFQPYNHSQVALARELALEIFQRLKLQFEWILILNSELCLSERTREENFIYLRI